MLEALSDASASATRKEKRRWKMTIQGSWHQMTMSASISFIHNELDGGCRQSTVQVPFGLFFKEPIDVCEWPSVAE
ncbi:unnamed protein product, partial [Soboliphyme baturini]|uniref:Auxin_canalis domain-containing protein n=1 Tax=Soboliphyme baturini TaxID=241478 RepID=A0A183IA35_9BILA